MTKREYPEHPLVGVAAVVLRNGRVLLVKRGKPPAKGEWSLPGGLVELGETLVQALHRELREELSITVDVLEPVCIFDRIVRDADNNVQYHYIIVDYCAQIVEGTPTAGSDAVVVKWVNTEFLKEASTDPMLFEAVSRARRLPKKRGRAS